MNTQYQDLLPISNVILKDGRMSLISCGNMCASDELCQTIFFKLLEGKCFLYNYSIWEYTPRRPERDVIIYEITSQDVDSGFVLNRGGGIAFQISSTSNITSFYAMTSCKQRGGSLISLDTNQKIDFLIMYIRNSYVFSATTKTVFQIGLNNTQVPQQDTWKWSNGAIFSNNLSMPFSLNNHDGNMANCSVGHCAVLNVKNDSAWAFDNCCLKVASRFICSKDIKIE
ncbi:uncharacterized protein LOC125647213 [Ostrea edulis]|uniref:uncharacterized protein LOC125647213 n=1 Tax=Ostrea edulis TaxID=37623 RepID=UPI00209438C1|nr:uncharacterized protein LOC125647213 [Ostrea edulis]